MIKISMLIGLILSLLWVSYQRYGIIGLFDKESRGRHCARGRSKLRVKAQHRDGTPVGNIIAGAQAHILPSRYYAPVRPSVKGLAHAA